MAVGRITGPLLASNLLRDGVNLAVETDLLYLDVQTGRIGVKTSAPQYDVDINGTLNTTVLRATTTSTLGLITVTKTATSGTIGSTLGPIHIDPAANNKIYLDADTEVTGNLHATGNITADGNIQLGDTTSTDTLKVGAEIISNLIPQTPNTYDVGSQSQNWRAAYFQQLVTGNLHQFGNTITNILPQNIDIIPQGGTLNIHGNVRIWDGTPIGTAPVTNNILYVNENGSDTNDGSSMDPSRACRTISAAVKSPLYKPGTSIKVAPGHYLEQNPIELKPYTSVIGSDLRTTIIEPINKTQDLFHVRSGCYIAQLMMFNGRSGRFPGSGYLPDTNRGAYATAFPPNGDDGVPVDVFQSPYIQNCTNQSGPWLYDGTMFVPNQTVQVPEGVGVATYNAGTQEIEVTLTEGEIYVGQSVNGAAPNQGFFNARTLLLANKPFIQEQVVAYVDQTFGGQFQYDSAKCARDTGLIIDGLGLDLMYDSNSQSVFSGLQYWSQGGYTGLIGSEITTTTNAFNYLNVIAQSVARGITVSAYQGTITQVTSVPSGYTGNVSDANRVNSLFTTATNILTEGAAGITDKIIPNGTTPTSNVNTQAAYDLLQANKEFLKAETIAWIDTNVSSFTYDEAKCSRDTGLIVDAIVQDLLFAGETQSTFSGVQYWNHGSLVGQIAGELTTTTNAISYVSELARKIIVNDTTGTRYQGAVTQDTSTTAATASEQSTLLNEFTLISTILNSGVSGITDAVVPNGITANTGVDIVNAYTNILLNKAYIQAEAVAYVEATKTPGYVYDQAKCERDVGFMVDSVAFDLLYGGNLQAIESGVYYWSFNASSTALPGEQIQAVSAYNYLKSILPNIITGTTLSSTYQSSVAQVTSGTPGTNAEVTSAQSKVDIITNIITNGPTVANAPEAISLTKTVNANVINAASILHANRNFLKAEIVAYVNSAFGAGFTYDKTKCKRDVGYLLDCVSLDLLLGGNRQVIQGGTYYYGYSSVTSSIPNEQVQAIMAYNYMKGVITAVVRSQQLTSFYQSEVPQVLDNVNPGSVAAADSIAADIDTITRLIRVGPEGAPALQPLGLTRSADTGVLNAYALLNANKDFIKAEVIAYVNTLPNFVYNQEKCFRDVGIIIENVSFDALNGGNEKSVESGLAYYNGVTSVIAGEEKQTVGAIEYIKFLTSKVIRNQTCPDLLNGLGKETQQINYVLTNGGLAQPALDNGFDIITGIITNGPDFAPKSYAGCAVDPYHMSAEVLLQANRSFIQEEIVEFVNKSFLTYPFNTSKCRRDTGLIVDAIAMDMMYPTASDSQSTFAGIQYWKNGSYTGDIEKELTTTTNAINYLSSLAQKLILNDISGPRYQTAVEQDTSLAPATTTEASEIGTNLDLVTSILNNGTAGVTDIVVPNGTPRTTPGVVNAYAILQSNKAYIQAEVVAYVEATKETGYTYSQVSCSRDVGYLVDSVTFDLLHGGNRQCVQSGVYYYSFDGLVSAIPGETPQTVSAYKHLKTLIAGVITGTTITERYQNVINQTVPANVGGTNQVTAAQGLVDTIIDIILVGPSAAPTPSPMGLTESSTPATVYAAQALESNKSFITSEIVAYINKTFPSYRYNNEKCARDTGLLVDAIAQDLLFEGESQSVFAGVQYWKQNGYTGAIASELTTTTNAIAYVSDLAQKVVKNITGGTRYQSAVSQDTSNTAATTIQSFKISTEFDLILELINDGLIGVTDKIVPNSLTSSSDDNVINAYESLQANKAYIQAEAVAFVESTKTPGFTYDQSKCSRDVGYMIDAVCIDLLYGGNRQAIQSGVYYWDSSTGVSAIASEISETLDAYNYLKTLVENVVLGIPAPRSQSNKLVQTTNLPIASESEATLLTNKITKITDIIQNGPSSVTTKEPISLSRSSDANRERAYALLMANREFIANEIVSYINEKYNGISYSYNKNKCFRDTGLLIDSIVTDLGWGENGFTQSNFSGLQYWNQNGYTGQIARELTTTTNAINYLSTLAQKVVRNDLTGVRYQNTVTQNVGLQAATAVEAAAIALDFSTVTNILVNGTTGVTDIVVSNGIAPLGSDAQHAYDLLQANKAYMQAEVIAWVEANKSNGFTYNQSKCERDIGIILDDIAMDVAFESTSNSTFAGVQYWNHGARVGQVTGELTTTTNAITYVNSLAQKIIVNNTSGPRYQSAVTQDIGYPAASSSEQTIVSTEFTTIINILTNGVNNVTDTVIGNGVDPSAVATVQNAFALLQANKAYIQAEAVAFVESTKTAGFTYDQAKCSRDVGYMIDAVCVDLLYGGNRQAIQSGVYYWGYNENSTALPGEQTQAIAAYSYIKNLLPSIVTGVPVAKKYQNLVSQITSGTPSNTAQGSIAQNKISVINGIIKNGPGVASTPAPLPINQSIDVNAINAAKLIKANKAFIIAETIAFINQTLVTGYVYDHTKCARDTRLIVDAVVQDMLFGGTSQSTFSGIQYWNQNGYVGAIADELTTTTNAISYVSDLAQKVIQNNTLGTRYQSTVTQNVSFDAGTVTEATRVASDFTVILDILENGTAGITDKIVPNGIEADISTDVQNAYNVLQANKAYIQAEAVAFVESTKTPGYAYDQAKCYRDVGYMIDGICIDLLYGGNRQAVQSGVYYYGYSSVSSAIENEQAATVAAYTYIKELLSNIVVGNEITEPYQLTVRQDLSLNGGTSSEVTTTQGLVDVITDIIVEGPASAASPTPLGLTISTNANVLNAAAIIQANKEFIVAETIAYIDSQFTTGFQYDQAKCYRDMGYLIDSISYDVLYGGNRQAVNSGVYYYGFDASASAVANEQVQTAAAYNRLKEIIPLIITNQPVAPTEGNVAEQQFNTFDSNEEIGQLTGQMIDLMVNIIQDGPSAAIDKTPIGLTENTDANIQRAMVLLRLNREFIQNEIVAWVDTTYKSGYYNYNQEKCYRDVGLIVDALSGDLLAGGNLKTIEAGVTYWTGGVNVVANEIPQQNASLDYLKTVVAKIVSNQELAAISSGRQVINPYFAGGQYAVDNLTRLIDILKTIIAKGPTFAPEGYQGTGAFATSNSSVDYIQPASTVLEVTDLGGYRYRVYLSKPVLGPAYNGTLYFGQTGVYPTLDKNIPDRWKDRRVDPYGSIGGALIDGAVVSKRSPVQSFVFDAFTQLNQGGIGIKITNSGYAQLVSVFTIFCGTSVIVENGGICSITNSNANFGDFCLVAKGYSKREFFGEVYNPAVLPYYPNGYFPQNQIVEVYCPDPENRPHIGQIMEVVPPEDYTNAQGLPGFLSAAVNTSTLTTGSITISGIDTDGIVIGQQLYARDQYGSYTDINGTRYVPEGTVVTDVSFKTVTLSESITAGGGEVGNPNYFTLYATGNAYYTVRSSTLAPEPIPAGTFRLGPSATENGNDQGTEEIQALQFLNNLTNKVVSNQLISAAQTTATQFTNIALSGGDQATVRVAELFSTLQGIITNGLDATPTVKKDGVVPPGADSAGSLLLSNREFLQAEIIEYVNSQYFVYDHDLCRRDLGYILDGFGWDVLFGSNYQAIKCGNAYLRNIPGSKYVLENEKAETTDAINKIAALTNGLSGISTVTAAISVINLDGIYLQNIINGAGAPAYSMPNPAGMDSGVANAKSLILDNLSFIKEEVIGWIDNTYPIYTYDKTTCKRDIGLVLDGINWDILLGTNYRSIKSGQAYFRGNAEALLAGEKEQTIASFNFIKNYLLGLPSVQSSTTATQTVTNDFANIVSILENGLSASPTVTYTIPPGIETGFSSASQLLQANLAFIKAEVEAYIHVTYPSHTYDRAKCARDVGFLMEAMIYDLTYGGNSMTVDAALQYFDNANNNVRVNPSEVSETVAGINYINTICQRVIQNLAPVVSYQVGVTQTFNPSWPQGSVAGTTIADLVSDMANIVQNGILATPIIVEPSFAWTSSSQIAARDVIDGDKELIASEAITFIDDNYSTFTYDPATCRRDMDYVIHSMIYDLTYGGNWQTVDSGLNYWSGATSLIPGEQDQTVGAFNYMLELMKNVSTNTPPTTSYQNTYSQFFNPLLIDGENAHGRLNSLTLILNNIVQEGSTAAPAIEYPGTSGYSSTLLNVKNIINTQKTSLVNQTITYIDNKYNGFEYNQALCKRDVGYVVDAIAADLVSGGNYNTVLCGQSYYAREGTHHYVTIEDNVADATLFPDKAHINFYRRSYMSASGYLFEYVGAGSNYGALPYVGRFDPNQERETVQLNNGKVFFTSTDQNGDFRIGPGLVISQATGVLSGRTFTKSLFANLTPFILAIEG